MTGAALGASVFFLPASAEMGASSARPSARHTTSRPRRSPLPALSSEMVSIFLIFVPPCDWQLSLGQILVTAGAELRVVHLVLRQQVGLRRRMRLMAGQAVNPGVNLGDVRRVDHIGDGVALQWVSAPELQWQNHDFIFREVILWKQHASVENREQVLRLKFLRLGISAVTLEAKSIRALAAQQVIVFAAVRFVAGGAALLERGLMQKVLLALLGLVSVASQADIDRVSLG